MSESVSKLKFQINNEDYSDNIDIFMVLKTPKF